MTSLARAERKLHPLSDRTAAREGYRPWRDTLTADDAAPPTAHSPRANLGVRGWGAALVVLGLALGLGGCASSPTGEGTPDPLEPINKPVYRFNDRLDKAILEPVANAYIRVTPQPVRTGVSNFFDNIAYPNVILNDVLQGKAKQGVVDTWRFIFNSTVGILGIFDVATHLGLESHNEDFGQTLGYWGAGSGAYLVLPLIGPNTVRDAPGLAVGAVTNGLFYVGTAAITIPLSVLGVIDLRARAADAIRLRDQAAVDPYVFTREAYLQRRTFLIYDGNPPLSEYEEFDVGE